MWDYIKYFGYNFVALIIALAVFNIMPKPKPCDYTTIPGLKPPVTSGPYYTQKKLQKGWTKRRKFRDFKGDLAAITEAGSLIEFLRQMHKNFGPFTSFYWSSQYVVSLNSDKLLRELLAFASIREPYASFNIARHLCGYPVEAVGIWNDDTQRRMFTERIILTGEEAKNQKEYWKEEDDILMNGPTHDPDWDDDGSKAFTKSCVRLTKLTMQKMVSQRLSRDQAIINCLPNVVVLSMKQQVYIHGHPIPPSIPILIPLKDLMQNQMEKNVSLYEAANLIPEIKETLRLMEKNEDS